ncbi:MAG: sigma-54 dependent transcriptional regulator [Nitrospirota bacterium]
MPNSILIIDDEKAILKVMEMNLQREGYSIFTADNGNDGLKILQEKDIDVLLLDHQMPDINGLELLKIIKNRYKDLPVIMVTAYGTIEMAVDAMKLGAFHYLTKPINFDEMYIIIRNAIEQKRLLNRVEMLTQEVKQLYGMGNIITNNQRMKEILEMLPGVADTEATILIMGETGTGKELIARAIHYNSKRAKGPFVKVNCTALSENILESELFGHEKGAFTGAYKLRKGRFEIADSGSIFLDEMGDIPISMQLKLLRVLQEMEFERVGGSETIKVDVRVIAATNRDLEDAVKKGTFREDLYYRINIIPVRIPPLRERKDDIPLLAIHFIDKFNKKNKKNIKEPSPELIAILMDYNWPGNIRELENAIERAVILEKEEILTPRYFTEIENRITTSEPESKDEKRLLMSLEEKFKNEPDMLKRIADELKINPSTLYRKRKKYGLI